MRAATEQPGVIHGHLKITSSSILFENHTFENVSTFLLPKVHVKKYFQASPSFPTDSVFIALLEAIVVSLEC